MGPRWAVKEEGIKPKNEEAPVKSGFGKNKFAIPQWIPEKETFFLAKFFAIFVVLESALYAIGFETLQAAIAKSQAAIFGLHSVGNNIFVNAGIFEINPSCTGLVSGIILAAIVFSLKKPEFGKKLTVFTAGALILFTLNYFRVLVVIWTGVNFGMQAAEAVHVVSWFSTTVFVLGIWYYFTKFITGERNFQGFM